MARKATALAGLVLAACALAAAGPAHASTVGLLGADELLVWGLPGERNEVKIRYKDPGEPGLFGVGDRLEISDVAGITVATETGLSPGTCVRPTAETVSCDAAPFGSLRVALNDGNDSVVINAGQDTVPARLSVSAGGGTGNDLLRGGIGRDRLFGEAGNDIVAGWSGNDLLGGGPGSDGLLGFTGNDTLKGGPGADALFGQKGRDRLFGNAGTDVIVARDGVRDRKIDCGRGKRQQAVVDRKDPRAKRCKALLPKKKKAR